MNIRTVHQSIKALFEQNPTFEVPRYQRGYAWEVEAIDDFIDDISRCLELRSQDSTMKKHHFFGGIVATRKDVPGSSRSNYEVIDGQQRLASFVMLVAAIIHNIQRIIDSLPELEDETFADDEEKAIRYMRNTIRPLQRLYLHYRDTIEYEYINIPKLRLSNADAEFFKATIAGSRTQVDRASHERIREAWDRIQTYLEEKVLGGHSLTEMATRVRILVDGVLGQDFTIIFMCADTRVQAYHIFQVLNDRGVNLTDGDLLRATTLELLDDETTRSTQNGVASYWDDVLAYARKDIDNYLRWYFSSYEGRRPKSNNLVGEFVEYRFECLSTQSITEEGVAKILNEVKTLDEEFALLEELSEGEWPYDNLDGVHYWDRERLRMLVVHLKHTNAMPLLLALRRLEAKKFANAVAILERFVFRYKTVGNAHIGPATSLYLRHSRRIRSGGGYRISNLRSELAALVDERVPESVFKARLMEMNYSERGSNKHIRYFLITLEDYWKWYEEGAQGIPKCRDRTRVYDFSNMTLDHVYPRNPRDEDRVPDLDEVKHKLGNLTIVGGEENDRMRNKAFSEKREILARSSIRLNRDLAENNEWTSAHVQTRTNSLVAAGIKVFVP